MIDVKIFRKPKKTGNGTQGGGFSSSVSEVYRSPYEDLFEKVTLDGGVTAIRAKYGLYSDDFISAKGASLSSGGAGATQLRMLTDVGINDGNLQSGQVLYFDGSKWVNHALEMPNLTGYATESWVTGKGYITSAALAPYLSKDDAADLYQPKGNYLTEHQNIYALTLQAGAFSAKTYNPKTGVATVNIPTTTSHISEGTNKYFTDARAVAALKTTTDTLQANIDTFKALFDSMFVKEADANSPEGYRIKAVFGLYSPYYLSAKGANPDGGGGGSAFGLYTDWAQMPSSTDALGAVLGQSLYTKQNEHTTAISGLTSRVTALEGKNYLDALTLAQSGNGNAVTSVSLSADKKTLTVTKGSTFLTGITKTMVEGVLTGNITSHTHSQYLTTTSASSTYLSKTDAGTTYLTKTDAASTYVAKEAGKGLSSNDFTTTLLNKLNGIAEGANKYIHPSATATTITAATGKVLSAITVNSLGHVTSVASKTLAAADIPTLAISKVSGLQTALDSKAAKSDFDTLKTWIEDLFEKVTLTGGAMAIRAKYGLYSNDFISAKGASDSSGGAGGVGYGRLDSWAAYVEGNGYVLSADLGYDLHTRLLNVYTKATIDSKLAGIYTKTEADGRYVTLATQQTITGKKVFGDITLNGIVAFKPLSGGAVDLNDIKSGFYHTATDGNTTTNVTNRAFDSCFALIASEMYVSGTDIRRAQLAMDGYGNAKIRGSRTNGYPWYTILTNNNYTTVLDSVYFKTASLKTLTIQKNGTLVGTFKPNADATLNITDVASASTLSSHTGNTTVHITAAERTKWNKVVTDFAAITGTDSDTIINKWEEVVAFLDTYTEADTLAGLLGNKADKTQLADYVTLATAQTITGFKTFNGSMAMGVNHYIYGVNESGGSMLHFDGSRTVIGSNGASSTTATHLRSKTGHLTCGDNTASYNILDTGNYSGTLDGRYVTLGTTQTITGVKTLNANIVLGANYAITSASAASAKITKTTGIAIHGGADKAAEDDANLRFGSWYGIGWYPTISGQTVAQGTNAMWLNVRTGVLTVAGKFVKKGGTSTQFLKADGSVDGTEYLPKSVFDELFEKVTTNGVTTIRAKFGLWTTEFLSAKGQSSDSGSAGGGLIQKVYGSSDLGKTFADTTLTDTFNAYTINSINTELSARITSLEGGSALSVTTTGSGNAITSISKNGTVITATKGATFLTAHQSLGDYFKRGGGETMPAAYVDLTTSVSGNANYKNFQPGTYQISRNGYSELVVNLALNSGSTSALQFLTSYADNADLKYRKTIDSNRVSGPWRKILTELNTKIENGVITINGTSITPLIQHQSLANYVTLNGAQTISGAKTFTANISRRSATRGIVIYGDIRDKAAAIEILGADGVWAANCLEFENNGNLTARHSMTAASFVKSGSSDSYLLLGGGGHKALSDLATASALTSGLAGKVSKSGDTMTGVLVINGSAADQPLRVRGIVGNSSYDGSLYLQYGMNKAVFFGNQAGYNISADGGQYSGNAATATNADMLDGFHKESFDGYRYTKIDASALDNNTWYPVVFRVPKAVQTRIRVEGGSAANASWNSRTDKQMAVFLDYTVQGSEWGWVTPQRVVNFIALGAGANGSNCIAGLGQLTNNSWEYVMVRGGAVYNFYISHWLVPELKTSTFTNQNQSIAPTTTSPTAITRNNAWITDNVASATKLQTARTLWGQSFNGTANVDGAMTVNYTGETGILLKRAEAGSGAFIRFCNNNQTANYFRMGMYGAGYFGVGYNGTDAISISTANNVGIGTTSPAYKLDVNGIIKSNNEIRTTAANGFRIAYGNYGFFIRNDGSNTYFMMTNSGDANGSYNSLRPLYINDSTGRVTMGNGLTVQELKIGDVTITYDSTAKGLKISGGGLYSDSYISAKGASTASGGASAFGLYTNWAQTPSSTDALGAVLGTELYANKLDKSAGVTALGTNGNYLTWTKNGSTNNLTVPYATTAASLTGTEEHKGTALADFDTTKTRTYQATTDLGDGISYSAILSVSAGSSHRYFQIIGGKGNVNFLRWRTTDANGATLGAVRRLLDDDNYSTILDGRYYTETEVNTKLTNGSVTKVGTATVGGTAKPIYLNAGTPTALSATVGAANRPVYMNAGTITAGTYTFGNASGNAPISNGTVNTNLNADLLDGVHASGLLTAFSRSGNSSNNGILSLTVGGTTKTVGLYPSSSWGCRFFSKSDNSGRAVVCLIADITAWKGKTADASHYGFSGRIVETRPYGYMGEKITDVICRCGYADQNSTTCMHLRSSNTSYVTPKVILYNSKYYLGIEVYNSGHDIMMEGYFFNCLDTFIQLNKDASGALPSGASDVTSSYTSYNHSQSAVYSATQLATARTINGTSFDGTANITTALWGTARNIGIVNSDGTGTAVVTSVNGSAAVNLKLPATIKAALTGNATTATTLQTTRTLWGQNFNGGANVSGNLTTVGNITGSGAMTISSTNGRLTLNGAATALDLKFANTDAKSVILNGTAFKPYDAADNALELGTDAARWKKVTACNMRLSSSTSGSGADVYAELWRGNNASWKVLNTGGTLKLQSNYTTAAGDYFDCMTLAYNTGNAYIKGSVGVGTTSPQHKLDVNGNIRAAGWLRTTGATGWVNDTYGGGLYMTDTTWVRIYGSKNFYQASGILRTDGTLQIGNAGTYLNASSAGMTLGVNLDLKTGYAVRPQTDKTCALGATDRRWNRIYAASAYIGSDGTSISESAPETTTIFAGGYMELYRSTPFIDFHFGNSTADYTSRIIEEASGRLAVIGTLRVSVGMYSDGYVSAKGQSTTSDERLKRVLRPVYLNVKDIAAAPSVEFVWKKDGIRDVGSIAQYWEKLMPQLVNVMPDGMKGLQYGKAALMGVIAVARRTESLESRVERLEKENRELKHELETIKRR